MSDQALTPEQEQFLEDESERRKAEAIDDAMHEERVNRGPSTFASRAIIGKKYLTKGGCFITVLAPNLKGGVLVRDELRQVSLNIYGDELLYPYDRNKINKEAIAMANAEKKTSKKAGSGGGRGGERGARRNDGGIEIFRKIGITIHCALFKDGVLRYRAKNYTSLKEVAEAMRGKAISGSGRSFFGLRSEPNIGLGKEVIKGLDDAESEREAARKAVKKDALDAAHKSFPKPGKAKSAKKAKDTEDDDEAPESKATGVTAEAGVVARGRGR